MTVHFIGAGPGDPELLTVRGKRLISESEVCIFAGSLVSKEIIRLAPKDAKIVDSAFLTLGEIVEEMVEAHNQNLNVARIHSGDPSLFGAIGEQIRILRTLNIEFDVTPGVPAFAAAAAALGQELTLPGISQTVILTRTGMKSSRMPSGEELDKLCQSRATIAIHLSIRNLRYVCRTLTPIHGSDYPVTVLYRVSWPDEKIIKGNLGNILKKVRLQKITRTALVLVGPVLTENEFSNSKLYDADHTHLFRHRTKPITRLT